MAVSRDSQFREWSKLLFDELYDQFSNLRIEESNGDKDEAEQTRKDILTDISRRTHDLAMFIVSQAFEDELVPDDILYKNGKPMLMYPENLAEWYKQKGTGGY
jgi:hypothetical protein